MKKPKNISEVIKNATKKVVINACYGGFGLSPKAIIEYGKLIGKEIYFYYSDYENNKTIKIKDPQLNERHLYYALFTDLGDNPTDKKLNAKSTKWLNEIELKRDDSNLIKVIEKLKEKANGRCSKLKIIEIPSDVDFQIEEYDGYEHIAEKHRTWS